MKSIKFDDKEYAERMKGTGADRVQDWLFFELKRKFPERYATTVVPLPDGAAGLAFTGPDADAQRMRFLLTYQVLEDIGALMETEADG